jgi:hypothetical protein
MVILCCCPILFEADPDLVHKLPLILHTLTYIAYCNCSRFFVFSDLMRDPDLFLYSLPNFACNLVNVAGFLCFPIRFEA